MFFPFIFFNMTSISYFDICAYFCFILLFILFSFSSLLSLLSWILFNVWSNYGILSPPKGDFDSKSDFLMSFSVCIEFCFWKMLNVSFSICYFEAPSLSTFLGRRGSNVGRCSYYSIFILLFLIKSKEKK